MHLFHLISLIISVCQNDSRKFKFHNNHKINMYCIGDKKPYIEKSAQEKCTNCIFFFLRKNVNIAISVSDN